MAEYKVGSISAFFSGNDDDKGNSNSLFSKDILNRFQRVSQPECFVSRKKATDNEIDVNNKKTNKKRTLDDSDSDETDQINEKYNKSPSEIKPTPEEMRLKNKRTIFVGNVPLSSTVNSLKSMFKEFGEIESIRMRSVPIAGAKVDEAGNQNLVKRVCSNKREFGDQKSSYNAYIVFAEVESATAALVANNRMIEDRHIRVDMAEPTLFDEKCTVFIGSLAYYTDEEKLRAHFAEVLPNGQDDIVSLRLIRDPTTLLCKGIGYMLLTDRDAVIKALELHQVHFKKRLLNVTTCGKRGKTRDPREQRESREREGRTDRQRSERSERASKKPREERVLTGAERRIQAKAFLSKNIKPKNHGAPGSKKKPKPSGGGGKKAVKGSKSAKRK
mmetsp:Transcript_40214/g.41020  ORF Transcript_40214/g.41020 Transcript_40214/m.41020 type:complete len:387 (+) Transcript_40214:70-1230(+)